jgi:YHS domain-containing protein
MTPPGEQGGSVMRKSLRIRLAALAAGCLAALAVAPATAGQAGGHLVNVNKDGVLVDGYDVVAYFTDGRPTMGSAQFASTFDGATYWFASVDHKALFDADPAKYAPQFGGFCAYAVSRNGLRPIDPAVFHFVDGRLFLQHTKKAYDLFEKDEKGNTRKADANWPKLVEKKAGKFKPGQFDAPVK